MTLRIVATDDSTSAGCSVCVMHRPIPLRLVEHHELPQAAGGKTVPSNLVRLCDSCHYSVHELMFYAAQHDGALPAGKGNRTQRQIALAGYQAAVAAGTVHLIPDEGNLE